MMPDGIKYTEEGDIILESPPEMPPEAAGPAGHFDDMSDMVEPATRDSLATHLTENITYDEVSRSEWAAMTTRALEALGIGPESRPDDYDYEMSDTSDHPLLLNALTKFQAKALSALMPAPDRVATAESAVSVEHIEDPKVRREVEAQVAASVRRVQQFYNWYLLKAIPAYEEDLDQIIRDCGLHGIGFRRIMFDPSYQQTPVRPVYVPLEDLILSYGATNTRSTGRITQRRRETTIDIVRGISAGMYRPIPLIPGVELNRSPIREAKDRIYGMTESMLDAMDSHTVYDVFTHLFLRGDPHPLMHARPYVVTIHAASQQVLSIRRNWRPNDPDETPIEHFAGYVYSPGRNALIAIGLGTLLTNMTMALRKAQRRGLDAAYLANHPSGFIVGGMSIRDDTTKFAPGELRPVDVGNNDIQKGILLNPFRGPDPGLLQLYDRMNEAGKELGNIASIDFASMMKSGIAAGPALAAYDESTEFQTSVHRRLYRGHMVELTLIHERLIDAFAGQRVAYGVDQYIEPDDLLLARPIPAMKPGHVSRQRSLIEAQAVYEVAAQNPQEVNKREAVRRYLAALGVQNPEDLLIPDPADETIPATDPVNEYMRLMRGEPLRAAPNQYHRAHIEAHKAQLKGLQNSELPVEMGELMTAALAAHIAEHEGLELAVQVAARIGLDYEAFAEGLDPEMEMRLAPQIAQAVAEIEAERRANAAPDPRVIIETMRSETRIAVENMRAEQEEMKRRTELEIARIREEAATFRNLTDNLYAIEIAEHKQTGRPPSKPDIPSTGQLTPRTQMPRFRFDK